MVERVEEEEYRGLEHRVTEWRRTLLERQRRLDELARLAGESYHDLNLAARPGTEVEVDSFLGTLNTEDPTLAYRRPSELAVSGYRFAHEEHGHAALTELRQRFELDAVAGGGSTFERATRLRTWVKSLWPHRLPWRNPPWDTRVILDRASRGVETYICIHYSVALVQCCLSLGIPARVVNLHRGIAESYPIGLEGAVDPPVDEHVTAETWCEELGRWVMCDTDFDCHYVVAGEPLGSWQIHERVVAGRKDELEVVLGEGARVYTETLGEEFYRGTLPDYYAHVSVLFRNDFLADPDGPVPVVHPVDEATPPILWCRGEDMRLHPDMLGPLVVAQPFTTHTDLLTDGNLETGWASSDEAVEHHLTVSLGRPTQVGGVVLHWPEWAGHWHASQTYRLETVVDGEVETTLCVDENPERPWTRHALGGVGIDTVRLVQAPGGGAPAVPNRLWLTQLEVLP